MGAFLGATATFIFGIPAAIAKTVNDIVGGKPLNEALSSGASEFNEFGNNMVKDFTKYCGDKIPF